MNKIVYKSMFPTEITKEKSLELKGVAILMMVFLHLFNRTGNVALCNCTFYVDGMPLVQMLTGAANAVVAIYLILSGYGTYLTCRNVKIGGVKRRVYKLYVHWWVVLLLFVGTGCLLRPDRYPGSWIEVLSNMTGWHTTYNGEAWFILPYVLVAFSASFWFGVMERVGCLKTLCMAWIANLAMAYLISRYGALYLFNNMLLYLPVLYVMFLFSFLIGAVACKYASVGGTRTVAGWDSIPKVLFPLCLLVIVRCIFPSAAWGPVYAALFLWLLTRLSLPVFLSALLRFLGKHSMTMWLTHTWFCYYLFHDFTYGLHYPLVIFLFVVLASLLSAIVVEHIAGWICTKTMPRLFC